MTTSLTRSPASADEAGITLHDAQPRTLGFLDMTAMWGNLGVSLLGPTAAFFVLFPAEGLRLTLPAAIAAVAFGSIVGVVPVGLLSLAGARTGKPAMVLLRGLFGVRVSYLPTVLNILQNIGWGIFEIVIIATAAERLLPWHVRWPYIVLAGALTTVMALRPLGVVRVLRRYALVAVVAAMIYLAIEFARRPMPHAGSGSWSGFWIAADTVIAVSISFAPLAADYTRHARTSRAAFGGTVFGYSVTQIACYVIGLLAYSTVVHDGDASTLFNALIALPLGWLPFAVLVLRELDESFANVYSTVVSIQNLRPLADRRVLAILIGALATLGALALSIDDYQSFLYLIGSVFIPLAAVFVVDFFMLRRGGRWDFSDAAPSRWPMLLPWLLGFCVYQLINPGTLGWWQQMWVHVQTALGFTPSSWMSASVISFLVAALLAVPLGLLPGRSDQRR